MTLRDYWRILRERWLMVVAFVVASVGLATIITVATPKVFQADVQVFVSSANATDPLAAAQGAIFTQSQVSTYAAIVASPDVIHQVQRDLNLTLSDQELKAKLSATSPSQKTLVIVSATDGSPDEAAAIANSAARAFAKTVEGYTTPKGSSSPAVQLFITDPATAPTSAVSPRPLLNISLGLLVGLLVGAALAVARDLLDNRIKSADALARAAGVPSMGVIVEDSDTDRHVVASRGGTGSVRAENFRQLRANLQFANVDEHPRVLAVTSPIPGEGKTTVAINLAATLAEAGFTVCLVDADLRRSAVARLLGLLGPVGLTSVLIHQIELDDALQDAGSNLKVLTSGPIPPNPSEVLASSYVREVVRSLLGRFDYVVLDTAPLLPVADGYEVAALADGTLLVARHHVTTDTHVRRAVHALTRVDAATLGVVLNRVPAGRRNEYGYTSYPVSPNGHVPARRSRVGPSVSNGA